MPTANSLSARSTIEPPWLAMLSPEMAENGQFVPYAQIPLFDLNPDESPVSVALNAAGDALLILYPGADKDVRLCGVPPEFAEAIRQQGTLMIHEVPPGTGAVVPKRSGLLYWGKDNAIGSEQ